MEHYHFINFPPCIHHMQLDSLILISNLRTIKLCILQLRENEMTKAYAYHNSNNAHIKQEKGHTLRIPFTPASSKASRQAASSTVSSFSHPP